MGLRAQTSTEPTASSSCRHARRWTRSPTRHLTNPKKGTCLPCRGRCRRSCVAKTRCRVQQTERRRNKPATGQSFRELGDVTQWRRSDLRATGATAATASQCSNTALRASLSLAFPHQWPLAMAGTIRISPAPRLQTSGLKRLRCRGGVRARRRRIASPKASAGRRPKPPDGRGSPWTRPVQIVRSLPFSRVDGSRKPWWSG